MDELGISLKRVPRIKNTPCMDRANPYILNITQPNIIETGELGMYRTLHYKIHPFSPPNEFKQHFSFYEAIL